MRRVRRSVWSKLQAENTAHPLSQLALSPRAPAACRPFGRWGNFTCGTAGDFFTLSPVRERCVRAMMTIHKTVDGKMTPLNSVTDGCWVNLINPSEDELKTVAATLAVEPSFLPWTRRRPPALTRRTAAPLSLWTPPPWSRTRSAWCTPPCPWASS